MVAIHTIHTTRNEAAGAKNLHSRAMQVEMEVPVSLSLSIVFPGRN